MKSEEWSSETWSETDLMTDPEDCSSDAMQLPSPILSKIDFKQSDDVSKVNFLRNNWNLYVSSVNYTYHYSNQLPQIIYNNVPWSFISVVQTWYRVNNAIILVVQQCASRNNYRRLAWRSSPTAAAVNGDVTSCHWWSDYWRPNGMHRRIRAANLPDVISLQPTRIGLLSNWCPLSFS